MHNDNDADVAMTMMWSNYFFGVYDDFLYILYNNEVYNIRFWCELFPTSIPVV